MTLKKGRAVAKLVKEVQILGDVSEAYGAEGSAPEGFEVRGPFVSIHASADQT